MLFTTWWSALLAVSLVLICVTVFICAREGEWRRTCQSPVQLNDKTVIITGGNAGLGKYTAIDLARRGARVIIACRDPQKAQTAVQEIRQLSGNINVFYRQLDLASLSSVRAFVNSFLEEEPRLDILVNNAGVSKEFLVRQRKRGMVSMLVSYSNKFTSSQYFPLLRDLQLVRGILPYYFRSSCQTTQEGHDVVFGTNHYGHFLLTLLLLDRLRAAKHSRVVTVSSGAHNFAKGLDMTPVKDMNCIQSRTFYPYLIGYAQSKLANILFTRELSRHLEGSSVTAYCATPGAVYTTIWESASSTRGYLSRLLYQILDPLMWLVFVSGEVGAQTSIYCAIEESITQHSGEYFNNCHVCRESQQSCLAKDDGLAKKLWDVSCDVTGVSTVTT